MVTAARYGQMRALSGGRRDRASRFRFRAQLLSVNYLGAAARARTSLTDKQAAERSILGTSGLRLPYALCGHRRPPVYFRSFVLAVDQTTHVSMRQRQVRAPLPDSYGTPAASRERPTGSFQSELSVAFREGTSRIMRLQPGRVLYLPEDVGNIDAGPWVFV